MVLVIEVRISDLVQTKSVKLRPPTLEFSNGTDTAGNLPRTTQLAIARGRRRTHGLVITFADLGRDKNGAQEQVIFSERGRLL